MTATIPFTIHVKKTEIMLLMYKRKVHAFGHEQSLVVFMHNTFLLGLILALKISTLTVGGEGTRKFKSPSFPCWKEILYDFTVNNI